ncbi:MAG TPA: hypothetical protein PLL98_09255 [Bacillota bacterium]|nr:hypothetical protein [Bacillota bacterium]HOR86660.1 hypothetical protein [Bacillota bacterium]HPL53595.1 hypothetical protein [Bacillota bacterium]
MFPLTHIWFSRKVLGYVNNMTVLGSVFPDTVIKCCLTYDQTHRAGWGLYDYFMDQSEEYIDFVKAIAVHTVNPRGLDFYGDEEYGDGYKGYCFQKASKIEKEVITACNIPEKLGLWKAHNFIEMGIELNISDSEKELADIFTKGLNDKLLIRELSSHIDKYFGLKRMSTAECFSKFNDFLELEDLNSFTLSCRYNTQMQVKHGIEINISKCRDIIEKCRSIVEEDFEKFIAYCTEKVEAMLKEKNIWISKLPY